MIQGILQWVSFLVVEIALFQFEIIFQPISFFLPNFAIGIKKQRASFKVLRLKSHLAQSEGSNIK
jgi:hypothetical protein